MDGYAYDIRDDQDHPPWQDGRWASMNGRPQTWRETLASPMEEICTWREAQNSPGV